MSRATTKIAGAARVRAADRPAKQATADPSPPKAAEELVIESGRVLTLRCGKSSITLHANGKIVLRGEYILSDAEGINRIAGGQIELN